MCKYFIANGILGVNVYETLKAFRLNRKVSRKIYLLSLRSI
jgi:hypothetical protein